jgi:hypothetical protein
VFEGANNFFRQVQEKMEIKIRYLLDLFINE